MSRDMKSITMEHQDGATTTTVSLGRVGSKFENNGYEYEIHQISEQVSSCGVRHIEIQATSKPAYGQSPVKKAIDELNAIARLPDGMGIETLMDPLTFLNSPKAKNDAMVAVDEVSKALENRPSISDDPAFKEAARKHLEEMERRKVLGQFVPSTVYRDKQIKSIVQSVVESLP